MRFTGFIGPAYMLESKNADCQRCVNLYPEMNELGTGKEREVARLVCTPGLRKVLEVGTGPIRCLHVESRDDGQKILVISGNEAYLITYIDGVWSSELLSTSETQRLETSSGRVIAASTEHFAVFVDGAMNCVFVDEEAPTPDLFSRFDALGFPGVPLATHVAYIDGYLVYNKQGTNQFFCSDLSNPLSVAALDFASAEADPDEIVALIALNRDLWLLGARSSEVWVNVGNADFPFERVSGGFIEHGIWAPYSLAKMDNIFWLGRNEHGQGMVFMNQGIGARRISTHAIEQAISSYANPAAAVGWCYQRNGHAFYVLNFAETTWVYDISTGLWHERAYLNAGVLERHRAEVHAFVPDLGVHLVGDYQSNKIYVLDQDAKTDDTAAIKRLRAAPHITAGMRRVFHKRFQLDMEPGVGLDGDESQQGADPQVMLRWSDDGGHSWSNEHWRAIGKIGEKKKRTIWNRLGWSWDRVYEASYTDPVDSPFLGAEIDVEEGAS